MSVLQRVYDTVDGGFVSWKTLAPDVDGVAYPGSGTFGVQTSDYCVLKDRRRAGPPPAGSLGLYTPKGTVRGMWPLDGDMIDVSPSANDLALSGATVEKYVRAPGSGRAFMILPTGTNEDRLETAAGAVNDPIRFNGPSAMTCEMLLRPIGTSPDPDASVVRFGDETAGSAFHVLWSIGFYGTTGGAPNELLYFHNTVGGGSALVSSGFIVPPGEWSHVAFTRDAAGTQIRLYVNGYEVASQVVGSPSTDGLSSRLYVGNRVGGGLRRYRGGISSLRVIDDELTAAQVLASARICLPAGRRP